MLQRTAELTAITLLLIFCTFHQAQAEERAGGEDVFSFAEALYEEADYFRAIGEYKRYLFFADRSSASKVNQDVNDSRVEKAVFRIAESYLHAQRWPEAIAACNLFLSRFPASSRYSEMLYLKGRVEKLSGKLDEALLSFDRIIAVNPADYRDKAFYQKALVFLERADWNGTRQALQQLPTDSPLYPVAASFAAEINKKEHIPQKSPATAGMLAAVLPGAGHLYTGRNRDGLVAFLLNGAFILGTVELFQHENYVAGGIMAFFELGWYSGNIYSAVSSAHKFNRDQEHTFIQKLKDNFSLALYRQGGGAPLVMVGHRF